MGKKRGIPKVTIALSDVREQVRRAAFFLDRALAEADAVASFDYLIASVYFARSAVELTREAAKFGQLLEPPARWDEVIAQHLALYHIVQLLRIQDFHRAPLRSEAQMKVYGSVRVPDYGSAVLHVDYWTDPPRAWVEGPEGTEASLLLISNRHVQTEAESHAVSLRDLMKEYIGALPELVAHFEASLEEKRGGDAPTPVSV